MDAEHAIESWNARWAIVAGRMVCTDCMQSQALEDCETPFVHALECNASDVTERPWVELHGVLDRCRG